MTADPHAFNAEPPQPAAVPPNAAAGTRSLHPGDAGRRGVPAASLLSERAKALAHADPFGPDPEAQLTEDDMRAMRDASLGRPPVISVSDEDAWIACVIGLATIATAVGIVLLAWVAP